MKPKQWEIFRNCLLKMMINNYGQSLTTKSIVALGYKFTQYLFIEGEF